MSSVINFYTKKGTRAAFLFFLLFDITSKHFHHLVGDDVFHAAGVFFGKFGVCAHFHQHFCKRLMPLVNTFRLFSARVGETEISRFAVDMDIPFLFKEIDAARNARFLRFPVSRSIWIYPFFSRRLTPRETLDFARPSSSRTSTARTFGCPLCSKRMVSKYISSDSLVLLIAMRAPPYIIYNIDYTLFSRKSKEKTRGVNIR